MPLKPKKPAAPKIGRPPKPPAEKYVPVSTRIPPEVAAYLAELCEGSVSGGARLVLIQAWENRAAKPS